MLIDYINIYLNINKNEGAEIDSEIWNEENLEWAIMIIDSRIKYIDYETLASKMYFCRAGHAANFFLASRQHVDLQ